MAPKETSKFEGNSNHFRVTIKTEVTYALRRSVLWPDAPHDRTIYHPDDVKAYHFGAYVNDESSTGEPGAKCVSVITLVVENENQSNPEQPAEDDSAAITHDGGSKTVISAKFPQFSRQGTKGDETDSGSVSQPGEMDVKRWRKTHFRRFVTAPEYQKRGIGGQLLSHVFRFAEHDLQAKSISTHAKVPLRGLYETKYGMKAVGEIWKIFDDELITLEKDFESPWQTETRVI